MKTYKVKYTFYYVHPCLGSTVGYMRINKVVEPSHRDMQGERVQHLTKHLNKQRS